jgi:hypothetical protein
MRAITKNTFHLLDRGKLMKSRLMFCTTFFSLLAATSLQAAPITVPTSLNPGDQYRLAFVTSGVRDATSPFIDDYNDFVQAHADAVPELWNLGVSWNAIGSTSDDDARDNTGTNPFVATGVPIFLLNDTKLVEDNADLWAAFLIRALDVTEKGDFVLPTADPFVWTGSDFEGVVSFPLGDNGGLTTLGVHAFGAGTGWIESSSDFSFFRYPLYGISEILTVVVPEPSSFLLLGLAGMGAIVGYPSRARRRHHNKAAHS